MTGQRLQIIVAYDIADASRARKVRKILSEWRVAGQKSVHICWLSRSLSESLFVDLCSVVNRNEDRLLMTPIRGVIYQTSATEAMTHLVEVQ